MKNYNFYLLLTWLKNLISHNSLDLKTIVTKCIYEQDAEENIWNEQRGSNKRLKKLYNMELQNLFLTKQ